MDPGWFSAAAAMAIAIAGLLAWLGRTAWRASRRLGHFLDDYHGQAAHDGRPEVPGFMARLTSVEQVLQQVLQETKPNHGASLRDDVRQVRADVGEVRTDVGELRRRMELFEAARTREGKR